MIYLDNAATTKMCKDAIDAYINISNFCYGNMNSNHCFGYNAKHVFEKANEIISNIINCDSNEIIYTSGSTEGNNQIIKSIESYITNHNIFKHQKNIIITSAMEHESILEPINQLKNHENIEIVYINPNETGLININKLKDCINDNVRFISIMMVNNIIGTIQPIKEIAKICNENGIIFHVDATQAMGHVDIDVKDLGMDFLTASAHKFNGPKGVGFIYKKKNFLNDMIFKPIILGGHQQTNNRAGTVNVAGIYAMAMALNYNTNNLYINSIKCNEFRKSLLKTLYKFKGFHVNGLLDKKSRLTNNLNFYIDNVDGEIFLKCLDEYGIYASSGSACSYGYDDINSTLLSMGKSKSIAKNSIRFSLDPEVNDMEQINRVNHCLKEILNN